MYTEETSPGLKKAREWVLKMNDERARRTFDESAVVDVTQKSVQDDLVDLLSRTKSKRDS